MKNNDIAMIILIASMTALIAFLIGNQIPGLKLDEKGVKTPVTIKVKSDVVAPSEEVFNKDAINPTVQTVIGGSGATN
jgi:hypothetical protein